MLAARPAVLLSCCPPLLAADSTGGICLCRRADLARVKDSRDVSGVMDGPLFTPPRDVIVSPVLSFLLVRDHSGAGAFVSVAQTHNDSQ